MSCRCTAKVAVCGGHGAIIWMPGWMPCVDQDVLRPMTCTISHVAVLLCAMSNIVCGFTIVS